MLEKENMELKHEPQPGYRTFFYIVIIISVIYLGIIFIKSFL